MTSSRLIVRLAAVVLSILLLALMGTSPVAAEQPPAAPAVAPAGAATAPPAQQAADPLPRWTELLARKDELQKEMQGMQAEYAQADAARRAALQTRSREIMTEFQGELLPEMLKLSGPVYEKHPDNTVAAEFVMQEAYHENRFDTAAQVGDRLLESGHTTPIILNVAGAAHFGAQRFEKARQILSQAKEQDALDEQLGGRFLAPAAQYVELWQKEQALRAAESSAPADRQLPRVLLATTRGDVLLELFEDQAPNTVANFVNLVERKHYDGTKFHRVIPIFMAQGGDPNSKDDNPADDGQGGPGYTIPCECFREDARMHFAGSISMAHAGKDSGGSQFFLTHLPTYWLNANDQRQSGHTVFGRVVTGLDIVAALQVGDVIRSASVVRKRNHDYAPQTAPKR